MLAHFKYNAIKEALNINVSADELQELCEYYQEHKSIPVTMRDKADSIAEIISNRLELQHSAEEWLNALIKFF